MDKFLFIVKLILSVVGLPTALAFYFDKLKSLPSPKKWKDCTVKNVPFWLSLVSLALLIFIEVISYNKTNPIQKEEQLSFFSIDVYKEDLVTQLKDSLAKESIQNQLLSKFEHLQYAWSKEDYEEAIKTLTELYLGKDHIGGLPKINSFVIVNDLGIAYFKKQRNRDFRASSYLQEAINMVNNSSSYKEQLLNNLKNLDKMVNNLD